MNPINDLTGKTYGRLKVIGIQDRIIKTYVHQGGYETKSYIIMWLCICECGNLKLVDGKNLKNGFTNSCGCIKKGRKW